MLIKILDFQKSMQESMQSMQESMRSMQVMIQAMQKDIQNMKKEINNMKEEINNMKAEIQKTKEEIQSIKKETQNLKNIVTNMEYEHGLKLDALYDYIDVNRSEHEALKKMFKSHDKKWFSHEVRIQKLEKLISNKA